MRSKVLRCAQLRGETRQYGAIPDHGVGVYS